ncbi:PIN domain-containing protein [Jiangella alkaliphila]|uniref:Ribonuclease VapC n=1 Tax=Jiangella alkaliphila TaxID=419479 RepID=A0A1H2KVS3_9ACTN|nr:type II toxin-antitoxin system VapC family toxin [Jiangella alkaliphila]SDU72508.1 Predicted nucleic-acid-binding protein, contains PIN domain [Jiangella alkaliphila]
MMIGVDTNVLVRYLTQDDPAQAPIATKALESLTVRRPGYLGVVTLVETSWVLRHTYGFDAQDVTSALSDLVNADEFVVENPAVVDRALKAASGGADFADAVIAETARQAGCEHTVTFDRRAAKAVDMRLLT